jgi:hypothetical protein
MAIGCISRAFDKFYDHLVLFVVILYIFPRVGILYQEKSGNPGPGKHFVNPADERNLSRN